MSGTKYTTQRIYISPSGAIRLQYGQTQYTSMSTALAGIESEPYTIYPSFADNLILIGLVTVRSTATLLNNPTQCVFTTVSKFGEVSSASSGSSTTTLQGAYDNSTSPEIVTDATRKALSIQNGVSTATDVDNMLEIQNYLGVVKANITAQGTAFVQALHNAGRVYDGADAYGSAGQVLSSTGTATQWITPSASTGDHKVQVSTTDTTNGYLFDLLYAGNGVAITNPTAGHVLISASGTGTGATTGLETFPIALATSTLGSPSGNSGFLESIFVPSSTVTITKMGVYCTQTASNYEMRIGVYSVGTNDTLLAQTVRISDVAGNPHLAIGLCIFNLVTPFTMVAGTAYGFAYMCSGQPQYFYVGTGVSGNAPAHTGRADNNPNYGTPVTSMITTASMSPGTIRPWIGAFV